MNNEEVISQIRSVLIKDWDPVGVGGNINLRDEYDGYIGPILNILSNNPSEQSIVDLLKNIEETEMGLVNINIKVINNVAEKLKMIGDVYFCECNEKHFK